MATLTDDEYKAIAGRAYEAFKTLPNVFAVGVGGRERAGRPTGEVVLKVFVSKKQSSSALHAPQLVPALFEGVPTDVIEVAPPAGHEALNLTPAFPFANAFDDDQDRYRPLKGGVQLMGSYRQGMGTLGFLARVTGDNRVMAITDYHVLFVGAGHTPSPAVTVGNPDPDESCTRCCVNRVGKYAAGHYDANLDIAIAALDPSIEWVAEIQGIGIVRGSHSPTVADATPLTYNVRKYGRTTRLTGGTLQAVGVTHGETNEGLGPRTGTNAVAVKPNPRSSGASVRFSAPGDSGSAYVNDANEILAVHYTGNPTTGQADTGWGWGTDIATIFSQFTSQDAITMTAATATAPGQVQTVPGARPALAEASAEAELLGRRLDTELSASALGRVMKALWMRHSSEVNGLVNHNRKVATLWHRNRGPALFQHVVRAAKIPDYVIPDAIDGRPVAEDTAVILDVLARYGSEGLRSDIARHRATLPALGGRCYSDILATLRDR